MAALDTIASELLKSANEADLNYKKTRDQTQLDKAVRLRRIVENLLNLTLGASDLNGLSDVTLTGVTNGQVLLYDGATEQWINGSAGGGGDMLKSTYDVDNTGVVDNAEAISIIGRNSTGATLYKGTVVYISGSTGNRPNFAKAQANAEATSAGTFGVVRADIPNNSDGYVVCIGYIDNLDTRSTAPNPFTNVTLADGDTVYLHPTIAGYITNVKPSAPNHVVYVGKVTRTSPTNGTIVYRIQNGYELDEIHDVAISSKANNDLLVYESATSLWKNKTFAAIFGGTPLVSVPTLDQVTTAGNTTTNAITVGGLTVATNLIYTDTVNGRVGIGTITPGAKIDVNGTSIFRDAMTFSNAGDRGLLTWGGGYFAVRALGGQGLILGFTSSEAIRMQTNGNVLIGTTTDAGYKLDVNGTARITNLGVGAGTSTNNISGDNIAQFGNAVSSGNQFVVVDSVSGSKRGFKFGNQGTIRMALIQDGVNLQIGSYANPASFVPYVTFDYATGNVGIGTPSPAYKFHISSSAAANIFATVQATNASASAAWVGFNDQSDNIVYRVFGSSVSGTQFGQSLTRSASLIANLGGTGKFLIGSYSGTDLIFGTSDQARMRLVDSTGNFLVGTMTDAGNKLEVSGTINATAYKINGILGWSGIINIPTMPPISITVNNGIITNVM